MSAKPSDSSTPLAEISHGPSKFELFLDNNQKLVLALAVLIALGTVAFVVYRGVDKSKEQTAGAILLDAMNADDLKKTIDEHSGTQAAKSAQLLLAENQWNTGDKDAAVATLEAFLSNEPEHAAAPTAKASLASKLLVLGQTEEAARHYQELIDDPQARYLAAFALISLGDISAAAGDIDKARSSYDRVVAEFSDSDFSSSASSRLRDLGAVAPTVVAAPEPLEIKPETGDSQSTPSTPDATAPTGEASDKTAEPKDVSEDKAQQEPEKDAKSE